MKNTKNRVLWPKVVINFIGWSLVLIGIYATLKTAFNLLYYKDKYPVDPVLGVSFTYPKYEADCYEMITMEIPPFAPKEIKNNPQNYKEVRKKQLKACLEKVKKAREETKIKDIWTSFMLLFLGGGILLTKRFYLE